MNYRLIASAALIFGAASFVSCIDPDQTQEVIFQNDLAAIEEYIAENPLPGAKEFSIETEGIYMFWEVSVDPEVNDQILRYDTVTVNYTGKLLDNTVFDTSVEQVAKDNDIFNSSKTYEPLELWLGSSTKGAISGFEYATSLMRVGEKATVIFPSRLGYGSYPPQGIPVNSPLVFEIELIEVINGPNHQ